MNEKQGWVKVHRKILDSTVFSAKDTYLLQLWIYILLNVNHQDKKFLFNGKEMTVKKGSGIFGLNQIVKDLSKEKKEESKKFKKLKTIYYRRLKILENIGNVKLYPTNKFTVVEVINWDKYQENETQVKLKRNSTETQLKTNKNVKNVDNDINISKDMGVTTPVPTDNSLKEKKEYGSTDINKFIKGLNKYLQVKLPDDGRARRVAKNSLDLFTKSRKDGTVKEGREFMYDDKWENVKWFLAEYVEKRVKKGFSAQSWDTLYRNIKIWVANNGTLGDN